MFNYYGGIYKSAIGNIGIMTYKEMLISVELLKVGLETIYSFEMYRHLKENFLTKQVIERLELYFSGVYYKNDILLAPQGSDFQRDVWNRLTQIPFGDTRSYKDIAIMLGKPNAMRAVGNACKKNPILFLIPCHRVISSNGKVGGYRAGNDIKAHLLRIERQTIKPIKQRL